MLRVVSGSAKGTKLISPDGLEFRPTLDRVKEAVFSMIGPTIDLAVLDLFSGSGALGIEALSRGASFCSFVDKSKYSMEVTKNNLDKTHLLNKAKCFLCDFESFIKKNTDKFDLVFLDPPYKEGFYTKALELLKENSLESGALIVCEMDEGSVCEIPDGYTLERDKKYGRCRVFLLQKI